MSKSAKASVAREVRELAEKYHVTAERDGVSAMAVTISRLAGDVVNLDATEQLLVNLKRKGILSKNELIEFQGRYLDEKRRARTPASA